MAFLFIIWLKNILACILFTLIFRKIQFRKKVTEQNISLFGMFASDQFIIMQSFPITENSHGEIRWLKGTLFFEIFKTFWTDYVGSNDFLTAKLSGTMNFMRLFIWTWEQTGISFLKSHADSILVLLALTVLSMDFTL